RQLTAVAAELPDPVVRSLTSRMLGLELERASAGAWFEIRKVMPGSAAEAMGIRPGDAVLEINGMALERDEDLRRVVARLRGHARAQVVVQRGPGRYRLRIPLQ
ncbi:MAG: PDZ domain-containing protein, partial [bacterium]